MTTWEVRDGRSDALISVHTTEAAAWKRVARDQVKAARLLNRPGLHGGLDATKFCERVVVCVGAVGELRERAI